MVPAGKRNARDLAARAKMLSDRLRTTNFCVCVLADSQEQTEEALQKIGFEKRDGIRIPQIERTIATGYLGAILQKRGSPVSQANNDVWLVNTPDRTIEPAEIFVKGKLHVWFGRVFSQQDPMGRRTMCVLGKKDELTRFLDVVTKSWRAEYFNPGGVTTDLEFALGFITEGRF